MHGIVHDTFKITPIVCIYMPQYNTSHSKSMHGMQHQVPELLRQRPFNLHYPRAEQPGIPFLKHFRPPLQCPFRFTSLFNLSDRDGEQSIYGGIASTTHQQHYILPSGVLPTTHHHQHYPPTTHYPSALPISSTHYTQPTFSLPNPIISYSSQLPTPMSCITVIVTVTAIMT